MQKVNSSYHIEDRSLKEFFGGVFHVFNQYRVTELSDYNKRLIRFLLKLPEDSPLKIEFNRWGAVLTTNEMIIEYYHDDYEMQKRRIVKIKKATPSA